MKITQKNQNKTNNRLLLFELANLKIYGTKIKKHFYNENLLLKTNVFSLKQISLQLKKILQIIYQYHLNRKKILVIGEKPLLKKQIFYIYKKAKHLFMPEKAWVNGLLSNTKTIKNFLKKKNPLLTLIKKPRLIVFYNYSSLIDSESYNRRLVNVTLSSTTSLESKRLYNKSPDYSILGSLTTIRKKKIQSIFSTLIEKIIKMPKLKRRVFLFLYKKKRYKKKQLKKFYSGKQRFHTNYGYKTIKSQSKV